MYRHSLKGSLMVGNLLCFCLFSITSNPGMRIISSKYLYLFFPPRMHSAVEFVFINIFHLVWELALILWWKSGCGSRDAPVPFAGLGWLGGRRCRRSGKACGVHYLPIHSGLGLGHWCPVRRSPQGEERLRDPVESNCESQKSHCDYFYLTPGELH